MKWNLIRFGGICLASVHCALMSFGQVADAAAPATEDTTLSAPANWFNLDPNENHVPGVSTEKAYQLLKNRPSKPVVVAVIDGGVDVEHEDLKSRLWVNEDEIPGNGIDDDKNGYVDDVHGWNFIGGKDGRNVNFDTYEITREYVRLKKKFENVDPAKVRKKDRNEYASYLKIKAKIDEKRQEVEQQAKMVNTFFEAYRQAREIVKEKIGKESLTAEDLQNLNISDDKTGRAIAILLYAQENNIDEEGFKEAQQQFEKDLKYGYNLDFNPRDIVGDNYEKLKERHYGNNDVIGPDASHGTHVAGIIGADRSNNIGMRGVADNVRIMAVRVVPNGDERDKDVANGIYYAVDNGAKVINMSFGKAYSPHKEIVDEAINYAASKGVLLVHAAGNEGENTDTASNFPTVKFKTTSRAVKDWIEVGASSYKDSADFVASFSNYGKNTVDVFAPGVDIYSTVPHQKYKENSGTSMAAPVTSGVAALLLSYFPNLNAEQVKEIILKSTVKYQGMKVDKPGEAEEEGQEDLISFDELSKTGGVVNAYEAVKMAESLSSRQLSPAMNR